MQENNADRINEALKQQGKLDLRLELDRLEGSLGELKVLYEQYFAGVLPLAPESQHKEIKRRIRALIRAPFKSSAINYRLRALETRYNTFNTYWQRILKQKEEGTYSKDVFKAAMRERVAFEEARAQTAAGQAQRSMESLFNAYRGALEKETGKKHDIQYEKFEKNLLQRAKDFKQKSGATKLSFKVTVKDGKVSVQIKGKKAQDDNKDKG